MKRIITFIVYVFVMLALTGCDNGETVSGKYYEFELVAYPLSAFSEEEINDNSYEENFGLLHSGFYAEYAMVFEKTGHYLSLDNGVISSSKNGEGTYYLEGGDVVVLQYSNGERETVKNYSKDSLVSREQKESFCYIREGSDFYNKLIAQKQNLVYEKKSDIIFEIQDSKKNTVLTNQDVMMVSPWATTPNYGGGERKKNSCGMQVDFNYYLVDYLEPHEGELMTVLYYGNPIMTFTMGDVDPFLTIGVGYGEASSMPAVYDLIDKLSRQTWDIDTEDNPCLDFIDEE